MGVAGRGGYAYLAGVVGLLVLEAEEGVDFGQGRGVAVARGSEQLLCLFEYFRLTGGLQSGAADSGRKTDRVSNLQGLNS